MIGGNNDILSRVFSPPSASTPERRTIVDGHPRKNVCTVTIIIIIIIIRFKFVVIGEKGGETFLGKRPKWSRAADSWARAQMLKNKKTHDK